MSDPLLELFQKKGISYTPSGQDYLIKCLNPDHQDSNPSLRVDKTTGMYHCFACGFKGNLFKHFGLLVNHTSIRIVKLKEKLDALKFSGEVQQIEGATPYTKSFRGISAKTLTKFGAFYTNINDKFVDRIFFPLTDVTKRVKVYVGRLTMSEGEPRYLYHPPGAKLGVFPVLFEEKHTSVVLVEGVFDFLNLYDKGLRNVSCIFGTQTLQDSTASKLMAFKAQGITKVYLFMDGDNPGRAAAIKLKPLIEEAGFEVEVIDCPEGEDPGTADQEMVDQIKAYIG